MLKEKLITTKKAAICRFFFILFQMKNKLSYDELKFKMQYYCSYQDRCHYEVLNKINSYNATYDEKESLITELINEDYLNETRFAKSFSRGKFKFKNWGRNRIKLELKRRKLSNRNIKIGLSELDENDYEEKFCSLFQKTNDKYKSLNIMTRKKKIFDYLIYRGWEKDKIFKKLYELK